jgi:hypothetical protein
MEIEELCEFCDNVGVINNATIHLCKDHMSDEAKERAEWSQSLVEPPDLKPEERESFDDWYDKEDPIIELEKVRALVKKYPNNMQLGKYIRAWALGDDL